MSNALERPASARQRALRTYATLLVHAEPELASSHRVEVAAQLARRFEARLIGLGAEAFDPVVFSDPFGGAVVAEALQALVEQIGADLSSAERAFRRDAAGVEVEWRSVQGFPNTALVQTARAADLIVVETSSRGASAHKTANPADVVMGSGRPVLIVPEDGRELTADRIVVAWKDTREARRAVADALPLLERADEVIVQAVCEPADLQAGAYQTQDVAAALKRHGVRARPNVETGRNVEASAVLKRIADLNGADLIVAGAYGHARLTEWIFGGVTNDLLHRPGRFVLMSH